MLRRSQSTAGASMLAQARETRRQRSLTTRPKLQHHFVNTSEAKQAEEAGKQFEQMHGYPARTEQIQSVVDLLNECTTFLLAGTGFGKSCVPGMFYHVHDPTSSPIILCINPLDTLGDDQVSSVTHGTFAY
ncbi:uncharacterized protein MELLADRAFT_68146 [Melampsora larici-populina 98AG31]|uniref:DEAD/DEAH box helicase domain-containing protein n=1 Tax=Melampsora larici-populina (strain 98AG31 / pathotype 3-4-7) TaxID=747676 RepID=F4S5Q8_MELLP|nr:uncharacterized protein MELLADRAFT_68146 [Melampsora larici-populina 98AG31]EGF99941.1 hypothetical protein MELLADRAFT_68146 [Melampsora larici-populina 98AG31]